MKQSYIKKSLQILFAFLFLFIGFNKASSQSCNITTTAVNGRTCLNDPICFTSNVTGACTGATYDWDFGDGFTQLNLTTNTVCKTYTNVNTTGYTVKCTVKCPNGSSFFCTLSGTNSIKVLPLPVPVLKIGSPLFQCEPGNLFNLIDSSYTTSGAKIVFRKIVWGDGSFDQVTGNPAPPITNKTHSYSSYIPGDPNNGRPRCYNITFEVRDEFGCIGRINKPCYLTVGGRLDVKFTSSYTVSCDSTVVTFTNTSTDIISAFNSRPGLLKSFVWDYGDGTTYMGFSINDPRWLTHQYKYKNKMGPFDVRLIITDSFNCSNTYLINKAADNIYVDPNFQVGHTGVYGNSDSSCYRGNKFNFKATKPTHPTYIIKPSYNFGDTKSGINNTYPNKPTDTALWNIDHVFSSCGLYLAKVILTVYQPNGVTVICSKIDTTYVKVSGPAAFIQDPATGVCVLNRYQCHIKDTVFFTNISKYCQGDSASVGFPTSPTVNRLWDFDDLANALPCTTYSDPITNPSKFGHRIADTMNIKKNCNYSMDSLPKHWYTPGQERCYTVKLQLLDLKTGCGDTALLSLALQPPKANLSGGNSINLSFEGQKCLTDGNDGRKVRIRWDNSEPNCLNQFVWINFDSACGINAFTPQTAFNPLIFPPSSTTYGCSYNGTPTAGTKTVPFSQQGHTFMKQYTKQFTSTCDPSGNVTIGLIVQNGCDSAVVSFQDSLWVYWTGCEWGYCPFSNNTQKNACKASYPNSASYPAYAAIDGAKKITFFNQAQKNAALIALPSGQVVCYACRDTFWYHNAIQYKDLASTQDANVGIKPKYCVNEEETFCPSIPATAQQSLLAVTWNAYVYVPGKPNFKSVVTDTAYTFTDTIYRTPVYKRLNWSIKKYSSNGNFITDIKGPFDVTNKYPRSVTIDSTYCTKLVNGNLVMVLQSIDTIVRDSVKCQKIKFTTNGKWVVNLSLTNIDTCAKENEGIRTVIVGNKIDFSINDTSFCIGEAVKPRIDIRYWWKKPSPPNTQFDPVDYWNNKARNPSSGGINNKEAHFINWGDGGSYIKFDTTIKAISEHSYNSPGNYTIRVLWKDSNGCFDTLTLKNIIHVTKPHAAFNIPQKVIACDQIVQFNDSSWIEQDTSLGNKYDKVVGWTWDFGDGSLPSALQHPAHLFATNGDFSITLRIFTEQGCRDTISHRIHIEGPIPDFEMATNDTGCLPYEVSLRIKNLSDTTYRRLMIDWGDGRDTVMIKPIKANIFMLSPFATIKHTYTSPGKYCIVITVNDTVLDNLGNKLTCTKKFECDTCPPLCVNVRDYAIADFYSLDTVHAQSVVTFTVTKDTTIYNEYNFDFGDGGSANFFKPVFSTTHIYAATGNYTVTFTPKYSYCAMTKSKNIHVKYVNNGINATGVLSTIQVYPNPGDGKFTVSGYNLKEAKTYQIKNLLGQDITSGKLEEKQTSIDISTVANGIYFLEIKDAGQVVRIKIVKN